MNPFCSNPEHLFPRPLVVLEPAVWSAPVVVDSPHSGRDYPPAFRAASRLDALGLRKSEDCYVDEIFACAPLLGAPLLHMQVPRAYVDVNREPFELDPRLFSDPLPSFANSGSGRVTAGLGTIARVVAEGEEIYARPLSLAEGLARIEWIYQPYHHRLTHLIEKGRKIFGAVVLLDAHSMPSSRGWDGVVPDIVLGDRHGTSADQDVVILAEDILRAQGFRVARNTPYAGGYITLAHGKPAAGCHALQLEINRTLYLDPRTLERGAGFSAVAGAMKVFLKIFFAELGGVLTGNHRAAE